MNIAVLMLHAVLQETQPGDCDLCEGALHVRHVGFGLLGPHSQQQTRISASGGASTNPTPACLWWRYAQNASGFKIILKLAPGVGAPYPHMCGCVPVNRWHLCRRLSVA